MDLVWTALKRLPGSAELVQYVKLKAARSRVISIQTTLNSSFLSVVTGKERGYAVTSPLEHLLVLLVLETLPVGVLTICLPVVCFGVDSE